jgi:ribosome recycling factor
MTEENRKDLVKILGEKTEHWRVALRQVRDRVREAIMEAEKNKEIAEDDKFKLLKDLEEMVSQYNQKIKQEADSKEAEIMKV